MRSKIGEILRMKKKKIKNQTTFSKIFLSLLSLEAIQLLRCCIIYQRKLATNTLTSENAYITSRKKK